MMLLPPEPGSPEPSLRRVLVVEDEAAIAMVVEDMLLELGFEVVGPFGRLGDALAEAERQTLDLAILDVNIGGEPSYPLADELARKGVPFVFSTGYAADGIDDRHRGRPVLQKPFSQADLGASLEAALAGRGREA